MPSNFEQVEIPDHLRADRRVELTVKPDRSALWQALVAVFVLVAGMTLTTVGIAWWVHPGLGLAILGVELFTVGILIGLRS